MDSFGKNSQSTQKIKETALYCEALKNSLFSAKDEIRRCFRENSFGHFTEREFSQYVNGKIEVLITIVKSYLKQYYIETDDTIVKLKYRFEKLDKLNRQKIESYIFEIFTNAKDMHVEAKDKRKTLENSLRIEIDEFVNGGK